MTSCIKTEILLRVNGMQWSFLAFHVLLETSPVLAAGLIWSIVPLVLSRGRDPLQWVERCFGSTVLYNENCEVFQSRSTD